VFFYIFVNRGSMTSAEVCQGFHDDKKVEEHWFTLYISCEKVIVNLTNLLFSWQ